MSAEEKIRQEITERFRGISEAVTVKRQRRIFIDVSPERWADVFDYLVKNMGFSTLCAITGLDEGNTLGAIYHLSREDGIILSLKVRLPKDNPVISTATAYFPSADVYERELKDLLGIRVEGLPEGHRYPLADDWPSDAYPLRKDWKGRTNA
jgi:Ni,Fe-hydrogenase III component G